jgi:electron transport complex protein RnfB
MEGSGEMAGRDATSIPSRAHSLHARMANYNRPMSAESHSTPTRIAILIDRIDAALPQTQCRRCGYPACRPYAEAVARGEAAINRCPPGGMEGMRALARLTGNPEMPLDPECGAEPPPQVALIDEDACIGCTKCIQACPVDAIVGTAKLMHTVVANLCTGCELCLPPCPVDCIAMIPLDTARPRLPRPELPCQP